MARTSSRTSGRAAAKAAALTPYVVLQAIDLSVLKGADADAGTVLEALGVGEHRADHVAWLPVLCTTPEHGRDGQPRVFRAGSGDAAIAMHTGKGADVIEGRWKAIPVSSWVGFQDTRRVTAESRARGREELM